MWGKLEVAERGGVGGQGQEFHWHTFSNGNQAAAAAAHHALPWTR
jgi:hypothetical protein